MIRLAAQHADEVVLNLASPFRVGRVRAAIDSAAAAAGRAAPRLTVWVPVAVNPGAAAHSQLAAQLAVYLAPPGYGEMFSALGFDGLVRSARSRATRRELAVAVPSELLDRVCALGSPDQWRPGSAPTRMPVPIASRSCPPPLKTRGPGGSASAATRRALRHRWRQRRQTVTSIVMAESR